MTLSMAVATSFPYWFFASAIVAGTASLWNALLVLWLWHVRLVTLALRAQIGLVSCLPGSSIWGSGQWDLPFFLLWQTYIFFQAGP